MKAIIAAGGFGTRMLPITKVIPKELLPVGTKPVIEYIVEGIVYGGIKDIVIVTSQGKQALEDYFDKNYELEEILKKKNKLEYLDQINAPKDIANICFTRQKEQLGLAHAVLMGERWINDDYFLASIGDTVFSKEIFEEAMQLHQKTKSPIIVLSEIPKEEVYKYGVVKIEDDKITGFVEKPKVEEAPSNLIISGIYILPKKIFETIRNLSVDKRLGEILLTDALEKLSQEMDILPYVSQHKIRDVGNPQAWLKANNDLMDM